MPTSHSMRFTRLVAGFCAAVALAGTAIQHGFAQQERRYLVLSTSGSESLVARLSEGCQAGANELGGTITCELAPPTADLAANIARMEDFRASGGAGIILETYGSDPAYVDQVRRAREDGVGTVVTSTSTIEAASAFGNAAVSIVGMSAEAVIQKISQAASAATARDDEFCILELRGEPPSLSLLNQQISSKLAETGLKLSSACPVMLDVQDSFEATLSIAVGSVLRERKVKLFILPVGTVPGTLAALNKVAVEVDHEAVFLSAAFSPIELGRTAVEQLLKSQQGEKVESRIEVAPKLLISTDQFCETCSCATDTSCKDSCRKCNK